MNDLEKQLYSWAPRRPSAKLKRRLFGSSTAQTEPLAPFQLGWLAPAAACCLIAFAIFGQRNSAYLPRSATAGPMVAMILSNQSYAAYLPGSFQREQNGLPKDTFEWTNGSGSTPTMRSLSPMKAND